MAKSRKMSKWFMTAVVGLMVVAMGGFGLSDLASGSSSTAAISVGKTDIDINEYDNSYKNALELVSQQQNRQISTSEARLIGLPSQVTQRMVQLAALSETARTAGIFIPDTKVASEIAAIPSFQDASGKADPALLRNYLTLRGLSESDFVKTIRQDVSRDLVVRSLLELSPQFIGLKSELNKKFGEARSAVFLSYNFDDTNVTIDEPNDADLQSYYSENTINYMDEPAREVQVAYLIPDAADVSDSELKAIYDNDLARFTAPATISEYYTLGFATKEDAEKISNLDELKALAKERSLNDEDFIFVDEAVKNLPSALGTEILANGAGFYGPIEGALGYSVYFVSEVNPEMTQSFDDVKASIAEGIAYDAMNEKFSAVQNQVLDLIAGGVSPEDIANETGLEYALINTATDNIAGVTETPTFIDELQQATIDDERDLISLESGGVAVIRIVSEKDPEALAYEAAADRVKADYMTTAKADAVEAFHAELKAQADAGKSIEDLAAEFNLPLTKTKALPRQSAMSEMPIPIAFELFSKDIGEVWDILDQENNYLVRADEAVAFDEKDPENAEFVAENNARIDALLGDQLTTSFTSNVADEMKATINPSIIEQVVGVSEQ